MKNLLYLFVSIFSCSIILSSCSVEKRVHRPGYHVDWHNSPSKVERHKTVEVPVEVSSSDQLAHLDLRIPIEKKMAKLGDMEKASQTALKKDRKEEVKLSEEDVPKRKHNWLNLKNPSMFSEVNLASPAESVSVDSTTNSGDTLKTIGWVLVILGLVFLLIVSILLGALLMLLGLVFVIAAPSAD